MSFEYDDDILGQKTKGKQVANTPETTVKFGAVYKDRGFKVVPSARYVGERYGDATNTEKVDSYIVYNALLEYETKQFGTELLFGLEVTNLFDKDYISAINTSDDAMAGQASYFVGMPRTVMGYIGAKF